MVTLKSKDVSADRAIQRTLAERIMISLVADSNPPEESPQLCCPCIGLSPPVIIRFPNQVATIPQMINLNSRHFRLKTRGEVFNELGKIGKDFSEAI